MCSVYMHIYIYIHTYIYACVCVRICMDKRWLYIYIWHTTTFDNIVSTTGWSLLDSKADARKKGNLLGWLGECNKHNWRPLPGIIIHHIIYANMSWNQTCVTTDNFKLYCCDLHSCIFSWWWSCFMQMYLPILWCIHPYNLKSLPYGNHIFWSRRYLDGTSLPLSYMVHGK